mgnify:FL=1
MGQKESRSMKTCTAVEMAALNFACAVMNKEPDDKVKSTIRELMEALIESELLKLPRNNP